MPIEEPGEDFHPALYNTRLISCRHVVQSMLKRATIALYVLSKEISAAEHGGNIMSRDRDDLEPHHHPYRDLVSEGSSNYITQQLQQRSNNQEGDVTTQEPYGASAHGEALSLLLIASRSKADHLLGRSLAGLESKSPGGSRKPGVPQARQCKTQNWPKILSL